MSEDQIETLSSDELRKRLEETQSLMGQLAKEIERKKKTEKKQFAQEIKEMIVNRGYEVDEIVNELVPGTVKTRAGGKGTRRNKFRYIDPDNPSNTYVSGPFALWMKRKMKEQGMDTESKEQRDQFKQTLKRVPLE